MVIEAYRRLAERIGGSGDGSKQRSDWDRSVYYPVKTGLWR